MNKNNLKTHEGVHYVFDILMRVSTATPDEQEQILNDDWYSMDEPARDDAVTGFKKVLRCYFLNTGYGRTLPHGGLGIVHNEPAWLSFLSAKGDYVHPAWGGVPDLLASHKVLATKRWFQTIRTVIKGKNKVVTPYTAWLKETTLLSLNDVPMRNRAPTTRAFKPVKPTRVKRGRVTNSPIEKRARRAYGLMHRYLDTKLKGTTDPTTERQWLSTPRYLKREAARLWRSDVPHELLLTDSCKARFPHLLNVKKPQQ